MQQPTPKCCSLITGEGKHPHYRVLFTTTPSLLRKEGNYSLYLIICVVIKRFITFFGFFFFYLHLFCGPLFFFLKKIFFNPPLMCSSSQCCLRRRKSCLKMYGGNWLLRLDTLERMRFFGRFKPYPKFVSYNIVSIMVTMLTLCDSNMTSWFWCVLTLKLSSRLTLKKRKPF